MLVYKFKNFLNLVSWILLACLAILISSSVSVRGDVSDTLVSLLLPGTSGDHDWRSNQLPGIMQMISRGVQFGMQHEERL